MMFEDENGRRPGDWTHRSLRDRAAEERREAEEEQKRTTKPWYRENFWIIFFLIAFWPAGLYLMLRSDWPIVAKVIVGLVVVGIAVFVFAMYSAYSSTIS